MFRSPILYGVKMKILKRKIDNAVIVSAQEITVENNGLFRCDNVIYSDCSEENCIVEDVAELPVNFIGGCFTYENGVFTLVSKYPVEQALDNFAKERDIDGIGEAAALLNSTNPTWKSEAETFVRLWDLTWQAFYNNHPLPVLSWV